MSRRDRVPPAAPNQWTPEADLSLQGGRRLNVPGPLSVGRDEMSHGLLYLSATSTVATSGWVKAPGTTTAGLLADFSQDTNNKLLYSGKTKRFIISLDIALSIDTTNLAYEIGIYKNGTLITGSNQQFETPPTSGDIVHGHAHVIVELSATDYVEGYVNKPGTETMTTQNLILSAMEVE
jgi:hypothetical protein